MISLCRNSQKRHLSAGHLVHPNQSRPRRSGPPLARRLLPTYVDHTRITLGSGSEVFAVAKDALQKWEQCRLGWVEPCWPETPIEPGQAVGILARSLAPMP